MNANDIRIKAQITSGLQLDETTSFKWVKDAIADIVNTYYKAGKKVTDTIEAGVNQSYSLSKEAVRIIDVRRSSGARVSPNFGYEYDSDNTIEFSDSDTYKVTYYSQPTLPGAVTDEIPIPSKFQDCIEYYLAAKIRARLFGQSDNNAVSFMQQYYESLLSANESINRVGSRGRRMPPRR